MPIPKATETLVVNSNSKRHLTKARRSFISIISFVTKPTQLRGVEVVQQWVTVAGRVALDLPLLVLRSYLHTRSRIDHQDYLSVDG